MVRRPLYLKITLASFVVTLAVIILVNIGGFSDEKRALEAKFGLTLQHIAQTAALFIDGDAHEQVHEKADAKRPEFIELRGILERVRRENQLEENQIYTLRRVSTEEFEFVIMLQEQNFIGDPYRAVAGNRSVIEHVLERGKPQYTGIYTDPYGSFVSGYAPIRDRRGRVVAVLAVDYGVDKFLEELWRRVLWRSWIFPTALLLAFGLASIVARSLSRSVNLLVEAAEAVRRGDYGRTVELHTRDEMRALAEAFNDMMRYLRERFAMLRFVPRHTRAIIAESVRSKNSELERAQRRDVAVFFSDIRGFTALSDRLAPDRIIHMLNIYLRKEAQIIERNNGIVDKFIGDAVMALFEGPDRYLRAARSAMEIQKALRALNSERSFEEEIRVGIGISGGDVVMGSIGYENRLEYAVIGRMVILASRLTSLAGPGEIIVSDVAWQHLSEHYESECLRGVRLKGFRQDTICYRLRERETPSQP